MNTPPLLSTAYLPPIEYFVFLMSPEVWIESREHYQKQSYRNRVCILSGNGVQTLSIPVVHDKHKNLITDVRIEYKTPWQRIHWKTIETAYNGSPFYLYYKDALQPFYERPYESLFDFNMGLVQTLLKLLQVQTDIRPTIEYVQSADPDLREQIHPKKRSDADYPFRLMPPYYQVFEDRFGFTPNLSIIDLLFNLGPEAKPYLQLLNQHHCQILSEDEK